MIYLKINNYRESGNLNVVETQRETSGVFYLLSHYKVFNKEYYTKRLTTEEFIQRAKEIHGNKYDYSKVDYKNQSIKVIIICPKHGEFLQYPNNHISKCNKNGCLICYGHQKLTTKEFIKIAKKVHNNKYNYNKVIYKNNKSKVIIICPIHGEFLQKADHHIYHKNGCSLCSKNKKLTTEEFIERAKRIHGNKYNYLKCNYAGKDTKTAIICPIHGIFLQSPHNHVFNKQGCPKCKSSRGELLIAKILKDLNITYERQKRFNDCINPLTKHKLSYDFYLPQENMLIEFNGDQHYRSLRHWHRNKNTLKTQQYRDFLKKQYALDHGYKFLIIKYNDDIKKILKANIHPF